MLVVRYIINLAREPRERPQGCVAGGPEQLTGLIAAHGREVGAVDSTAVRLAAECMGPVKGAPGCAGAPLTPS